MLGYVHCYTHNEDEAYEILTKARKSDRKDMLISQLLEKCLPPDVVLDEMGTERNR